MLITRDFLKTIAARPGVYLMKDAQGEVLYVGKARNLRKRLASYARTDLGRHAKTASLLSRVRNLETILTRTEKEALILEASLIKKYRPKYNVILRDDKNYPLIKVTVQEEWPRILMTRRRLRDGARYFGPYSSPSSMWKTLGYLNSLFPLRRCKGKELKKQDRPCLNFQMERCLGPCVGRIGPGAYMEMVRNVLMILEGKNRQVVKALEARMEEASGALRFEEAALYRDRIRALQKTLEKQLMVADHSRDQDIFGFVRQGVAVAVAVLFVRNGVVGGQQSFFLPEPVGDDAEVLNEVLERFYDEERPVPQEVLLPFVVDGAELLAEWLSDRKGRKVSCLAPQRGDKMHLLRMAEENAAQVFIDRSRKARSWQGLSDALRATLHLAKAPQSIECLDISNISGEMAVGALVAFLDGEKNNRGFRRYKIRTKQTPDDYAMMAEVLARRFKRGKEENNLPDILMVDGGKGQLNVAKAAAQQFGVVDQVELVGIAKGRDDKGEKLYRPGRKNPVILARHSPVLLFLMRVRDEAHRYGITFHRKLRAKKTLASRLDEIPGLGPLRKKALLRTLGSVKKIGEATVEDLSGIPGIGPDLARRIREYFHAPGQ